MGGGVQDWPLLSSTQLNSLPAPLPLHTRTLRQVLLSCFSVSNVVMACNERSLNRA